MRTFLTLSAALPAIGLTLFVTGIPLAADDAEGAHANVRHRVPVVLIVFDEFPVS